MSEFAVKLLPAVKLSLRETSTDFDEEIISYIDACADNLQSSGISKSFFDVVPDQEINPQIIQAVRFYCLSNFGLYNADMEKYDRSYQSLKATLCTMSKFTGQV